MSIPNPEIFYASNYDFTSNLIVQIYKRNIGWQTLLADSSPFPLLCTGPGGGLDIRLARKRRIREVREVITENVIPCRGDRPAPFECFTYDVGPWEFAGWHVQWSAAGVLLPVLDN